MKKTVDANTEMIEMLELYDKNFKVVIKKGFCSQLWWLMLVVSALWEAKAAELLTGDQPDQHDETPSLLKIQKLVRHGGMRL